MGISNPYRERVTTIMAKELIKQQTMRMANKKHVIVYQRNIFIKRNLRTRLIETLGSGLSKTLDTLFPAQKETDQEPTQSKSVDTFDEIIDFFAKTIEMAFGGEDFTPNEVTDYLLTSEEAISPFDVSTGGMFLFKYEPTTKNQLKYYDTLPMVIMVGRTSDGFVGLNLHYLPNKFRIAFMRRLFTSIDFSKVDNEDEIETRLQVEAAYKLIRPMYKTYKYDGIASRMVRIPIENWLMASLLPISKFQGKSQKEVWDESRKIILDEERRL